MRLRPILTCLALTAVGLAPASAGALTQPVAIRGISFDPAHVELVTGDEVRWENEATILHTVTHRGCLTGGPCAFDREVPPGTTFTQGFAEPGVFRYQCRIHGFSASITVAGPAGALPDLTIDALEGAPATAFGLPVPATTRLRLEASNVGEAPSPAAGVLFEYRYRGRWHPIERGTMEPVGPGQTLTRYALWDTSHMVGDVLVRARLDPEGSVTEVRETNNEASATVSLWLPPGALPGLDLLDPLG